MSAPIILFSPKNFLHSMGLSSIGKIHYQLSPGELVRQSIRRKEGSLSDTGALVISTGKFTGRSPKDKFIVKDELTEDTVDWNRINQPMAPKYFDILFKKMMNYLNEKELWIRDCYACADPDYRVKIRILNEDPAGNLFAYNMFLRPDADKLKDFVPDWHIIHVPGFEANPQTDGTRQRNFTIINFKKRIILIGGSGYTGEIKKGIFSVLNFILPHQKDVLSMHCSANIGKDGHSAIFFGLSGTGKTTLSADPSRKLIGDDEHGWSCKGLFNLEGGCYAKTMDLDPEQEPEIYNAIGPGALVENVTFFKGTNKIDFAGKEITENTRVSYPVSFIRDAVHPSVGPLPKNIFLLTCDSHGILPPISRLNKAQAMYQFLSGYTAKIAGTEAGVNEPQPVFSACFGAPFLPLHPVVYAEMLGANIEKYDVKVWMINTGWTGGPYGKGSRIKLSYTRSMIAAALDGKLDDVKYQTHSIFRFSVPTTCPGVPDELLIPDETWSNRDEYLKKAGILANKFIENFKKFAAHASGDIIAAGPIPDR